MINYNEIYTQKTNDAFDNIEKTGLYKGRLMMVRISKQTEQYVEKGKDPKTLVSFVWDCKNKAGKSVHVSTKPCTLSFTDKSNLPGIWAAAGKITNLDEYLKLVYDKAGEVKDIFATLNVEVKEKENGNFATVLSIAELEEPIKDFGVTKVTDYDKKVYGVEALNIDFNPVYTDQAEGNDELFARLANA